MAGYVMICGMMTFASLCSSLRVLGFAVSFHLGITQFNIMRIIYLREDDEKFRFLYCAASI